MNPQKHKETISRRRTGTVRTLTAELNEEGRRAFRDWLARCERMGIPVTPHARLEWLYDYVELHRAAKD